MVCTDLSEKSTRMTLCRIWSFCTEFAQETGKWFLSLFRQNHHPQMVAHFISINSHQLRTKVLWNFHYRRLHLHVGASGDLLIHVAMGNLTKVKFLVCSILLNLEEFGGHLVEFGGRERQVFPLRGKKQKTFSIMFQVFIFLGVRFLPSHSAANLKRRRLVWNSHTRHASFHSKKNYVLTLFAKLVSNRK